VPAPRPRWPVTLPGGPCRPRGVRSPSTEARSCCGIDHGASAGNSASRCSLGRRWARRRWRACTRCGYQHGGRRPPRLPDAGTARNVVVTPLERSSAAPSAITPVHVLIFEPCLARPDGLKQPAVEREPVARATQERHGRVPMTVDQTWHQQPPSRRTSVVDAGGTCQGSPTHEISPSSISTALAPEPSHRCQR